jgi:ankyrin repeat protein
MSEIGLEALSDSLLSLNRETFAVHRSSTLVRLAVLLVLLSSVFVVCRAIAPSLVADRRSGQRSDVIVASHAGDVSRIAELLDLGVSPNTVDPGVFGCGTALMVAAEAGQTEAVKLLLDRGADVDAVDANGETALMYAAQAGHPRVVRLLVARGASVNLRDHDGATALGSATRYGPSPQHDEVIAILKAAGARR